MRVVQGRFVLVFLSFVFLVSCKSIGSSTNVVGGIPAERFTSVVPLITMNEKANGTRTILTVCSAMVVSDTTLITSGDCFLDSAINLVGIRSSENLYTTKIFRKNAGYDRSEEYVKYDIGVAVFPEGLFKNLDKVRLATYKPVVGEDVRIVGYGGYTTKVKKNLSGDMVTKIDPKKPMIKRTGTNILSAHMYCPEGMLEVHREGKPTTDKKLDRTGKLEYYNASLSNGDSGGPMFRGETSLVLGIASLQNIVKDTLYDCYSSPILEGNLSFLKRMVETPTIGADIPGIYDIEPLKYVSFNIK